MKIARIVVALGCCVAVIGAVPAAPPNFYHVDLQPYANQPLDEDFHPGDYPGDNLSELKPGRTELNGIPFQVGSGVVQLAGELLQDFPHSAEDIEVGKRGVKVHFLHAARWGAYGKQGLIRNHWVPDGTPIGFYEVVYEDEHVEAIPIVYGADVRDWWNVWDDSRPTTRSEVVWNGNNPFVRRAHRRTDQNPGLRLFLTTWKNPHPDRLISQINFVSLEQVATPFCVAVTVQALESPQSAEILELQKQITELQEAIRVKQAQAEAEKQDPDEPQ